MYIVRIFIRACASRVLEVILHLADCSRGGGSKRFLKNFGPRFCWKLKLIHFFLIRYDKFDWNSSDELLISETDGKLN